MPYGQILACRYLARIISENQTTRRHHVHSGLFIFFKGPLRLSRGCLTFSNHSSTFYYPFRLIGFFMGSIMVKPGGYEADLAGLPGAGYWHLFRNAVRVRVSGWSAPDIFQ